MLKRLLDGMIFGTGFSIAFVIIWTSAYYFILPIVAEKTIQSIESSKSIQIDEVPSINPPNKFLGSTNITSSDFSRTGKILVSGDGKITGSAMVNDKPVAGLKLRLALNGSVYSQWGITDSDGKYAIHVPYGEYQIDGFDIDQATANKCLPNKITHPQHRHTSSKFKVSSTNDGEGLNFRFIDPVVKNFVGKTFSKSEDVVLTWEDYPGATTYTVQINEQSDPYTWGNKPLFNWSDKPELLQARINLNDYKINLTPGKYYTVNITARNEDETIISESPHIYSGYDFKIID